MSWVIKADQDANDENTLTEFLHDIQYDLMQADREVQNAAHAAYSKFFGPARDKALQSAANFIALYDDKQKRESLIKQFAFSLSDFLEGSFIEGAGNDVGALEGLLTELVEYQLDVHEYGEAEATKMHTHYPEKPDYYIDEGPGGD